MGVELEGSLLRRPRIRDLLPLHLPVRDSSLRPQGNYPSQLLDLPRKGRHTHHHIRQGEEHTPAGTLPRSYICIQRCRTTILGQPLRVLPRPQK